MRLDADQLEWIVREVVRRLRDGANGSPLPSAGVVEKNGDAPKDAHIVLDMRLVTAATLEHKLAGVTRVTIPQKAVITPSARDLLKQHDVELHRS